MQKLARLAYSAEMAKVEKTHEMYFLEKAKTRRIIGLFEFLFRWGPDRSFNDLRPEAFRLRPRTKVAG